MKYEKSTFKEQPFLTQQMLPLAKMLPVPKSQGLIQAAFDFGIPILGTLIWACPNLILSKAETTIKCNSSFLVKLAT